MVDGIMRDEAFCFVVIPSAGVQVPIEAGEVATRHFYSNSMASLEVVAGRYRLQGYLIHLARLHPDVRFVVTVPIPHSLNRFIQIIGTAIWINIDQFHCEICILRIGRNIESYFNRTAYFDSFLQRLAAIDQNIGSSLHLALVESAAGNRVSGAANIAAIRRHWIHRIVLKLVRVIRRRRGLNKLTVTIERVCLAAARQEEANRLRATRWPR